jgi:hypothetical protein
LNRGNKPIFEAKGSIIAEEAWQRQIERYQLQEEPAHYNALFGVENDEIGPENTFLWDVNND